MKRALGVMDAMGNLRYFERLIFLSMLPTPPANRLAEFLLISKKDGLR